MDAILVTGRKMRDARKRQAEERIKRNEEWGTKDMEHQDWLCKHYRSTHQVSPFWWFLRTFFNTTHPNSAIDSLWLTHSLKAVPHSSSSQVIRIKSSFHFLSNFPMMSHCVLFILISFWFIIWFVMLFWKELSGIFPLTHDEHRLLISEMLLSRSAFPSCI